MPLRNKDYYKTLQVDPSADQEVIEAAYKRLARKYHPDTNKSSDATLRMQEINAAYGVLRKPDKRAQYDRERSFQSSWPDSQYEEEQHKREEAELAQHRVKEKELVINYVRAMIRRLCRHNRIIAPVVACCTRTFAKLLAYSPGMVWLITAGFFWGFLLLRGLLSQQKILQDMRPPILIIDNLFACLCLAFIVWLLLVSVKAYLHSGKHH